MATKQRTNTPQQQPVVTSSYIDPNNIPADQFEEDIIPQSFVEHIRHTPITKIFFYQLPTFLVTLSIVYVLYSFLVSATVSYYFMLLLFLVCCSSCALIYPDKLAKLLAVPIVILFSAFVCYRLGFCTERIFTILSGIVGVLACLSLNIMSVLTGHPVSSHIQVVCFASSLTVPLLASFIELTTKNDIYLEGILISWSAALFNLVLNRSPNSVSLGIEGRDFPLNSTGSKKSATDSTKKSR